MRWFIAFMLLASTAFGQRVAVIGDTVLSSGGEAPWANGAYGCIMLTDTANGMMVYTAVAGAQVDSGGMYLYPGSGTIVLCVYDITDTSGTIDSVGAITLSVPGSGQVVMGDFNPNITLTAGHTYAVAEGSESASIGGWLRDISLATNLRQTSLTLADPFVVDDDGGAYTYHGFATVISGLPTKNTIEGITASGALIGN